MACSLRDFFVVSPFMKVIMLTVKSVNDELKYSIYLSKDYYLG